MPKLIKRALIFLLLLSGFSLREARMNIKQDEKQNSAMEVSRRFLDTDNTPVFLPKAAITFSAIKYDSTSSVIKTIDRKIDVAGVEYHLWRSADGQAEMKTFLAGNRETNFSFLFDTKDFSRKRGEYQIEAYGMFADGRKILLATSTMVFPQHVPILMYHGIDHYRGKGIKELFVTPANFEKQMQYLKDNGYTLLTFEQWDEINKVNKPIFVTFDDGIKDNLNALHILEKLRDDHFQPTATEFAIAGYIDSGAYRLSTADLKEMINSGIFSIQSHTMSHVNLTNITNYEQELNEAKLKIEQITGKPVIAIAYPSGKVNDRVVKETKKSYKFAVTTKFGQFIEKGASDELLLMQRIRISNTMTIKEFAAFVASK
jgi:peptidoglycan/xylan/chitin deacetylase (PgdA/CDA1 family)